MFIQNIQNPSKFYHSPWFWAGTLLSLGTVALMTIGLLGQFQVIHHIGSFSHQSVRFFSGAAAFSGSLGAAGCLLLGSIKRPHLKVKTTDSVDKIKKTKEDPNLRESEKFKEETVISSLDETKDQIAGAHPDKPNVTPTLSRSNTSDSTSSETQEKKKRGIFRKKKNAKIGSEFRASKVWVYDPYIQIVGEKEIEASGLGNRLELYGFLPQPLFKKLKEQFSDKPFNIEALKDAICQVDDVVAIVYRGSIILNYAEQAVIETKDGSLKKNLGKGLQIFQIKKEDQQLRITKKNTSSSQWESIPICKPSWSSP